GRFQTHAERRELVPDVALDPLPGVGDVGAETLALSDGARERDDGDANRAADQHPQRRAANELGNRHPVTLLSRTVVWAGRPDSDCIRIDELPILSSSAPPALSLKDCLKRGVLVTAANWHVVVVQFIADALFKTLLAVPIVGGVFLAVLLIGGEPS